MNDGGQRCRGARVRRGFDGRECGAAAGDADGDALRLADSATAAPIARSNWRGTFEAAAANYGAASQTGPVTLNDNLRVSSTLAYDGAFGAWRVIVSNRIDAGWRAGASETNAVDTLQQAYVSWRASPNAIVDAGRINLREGVASGFNPTDFFKAGALRSVVSIDPESLRENRLGSVMARGQILWDGGSATALVSPRIGTRPSAATFNPDFGATNRQTRYMLSVSPRLFGDFAPQWMLYGGERISPQFGVNATALIDDATVGFVEYAIGRGNTIGDAAPVPKRLTSKLATGFTHTFANKLSLTLEYDYDGASASRAGTDDAAVVVRLCVDARRVRPASRSEGDGPLRSRRSQLLHVAGGALPLAAHRRRRAVAEQSRRVAQRVRRAGAKRDRAGRRDVFLLSAARGGAGSSGAGRRPVRRRAAACRARRSDSADGRRAHGHDAFAAKAERSRMTGAIAAPLKPRAGRLSRAAHRAESRAESQFESNVYARSLPRGPFAYRAQRASTLIARPSGMPTSRPQTANDSRTNVSAAAHGFAVATA